MGDSIDTQIIIDLSHCYYRYTLVNQLMTQRESRRKVIRGELDLRSPIMKS